MLTTNPFDVLGLDGDKLHEECGVFGIWGADNASSFVAPGPVSTLFRGTGWLSDIMNMKQGIPRSRARRYSSTVMDSTWPSGTVP